MWPFKRKIDSEPKKVVNSILCIPGLLKDGMQIFKETNGAYMVVGNVLMDVKNKRHYSFDLCLPDSRMKKSFEVAGKVTRMSIDSIDRHTSVAYISSETGNTQNAYSLAIIGAIFLKYGSEIGIKVENTGKAFEKDAWLNLVKKSDISSLYEMFVFESIVNELGEVYSCGMHNLGYADAIILNENFQNSIEIIRIFNFYQLVDKPFIISGQTFQTSKDSPFYRIKEVLDQPNKGVELFENPFGMWSLERIK